MIIHLLVTFKKSIYIKTNSNTITVVTNTLYEPTVLTYTNLSLTVVTNTLAVLTSRTHHFAAYLHLIYAFLVAVCCSFLPF